MNVKRNDMIRQLVEKGYTKKAATSVIDEFTNLVLENLGDGNSVSIRGFGCFDLLERRARQCPNPQTGEMVDVPAHWIPRFYPGRQMKSVVALWEDSHDRGLS